MNYNTLLRSPVHSWTTSTRTVLIPASFTKKFSLFISGRINIKSPTFFVYSRSMMFIWIFIFKYKGYILERFRVERKLSHVTTAASTSQFSIRCLNHRDTSELSCLTCMVTLEYSSWTGLTLSSRHDCCCLVRVHDNAGYHWHGDTSLGVSMTSALDAW